MQGVTLLARWLPYCSSKFASHLDNISAQRVSHPLCSVVMFRSSTVSSASAGTSQITVCFSCYFRSVNCFFGLSSYLAEDTDLFSHRQLFFRP
jgi:hypothetical protein